MSGQDQVNLIYKEVLHLRAKTDTLVETVATLVADVGNLKVVRSRWETALVSALVSGAIGMAVVVLGG